MRAGENIYEDILRSEGLGVIQGLEGTSHGSVAHWSGGIRREFASTAHLRRLNDIPERMAFWAKVGVAASDLPRNYHRRRFVLDVAGHGNLAKASRRHRMTRATARWTWARFLRSIGLGGSRPARSVTSGTPGAERERRRRG